MRLIEIFKDDGDIHIDDNHEVDNDERHKIDNGYKREATVSIRKVFIEWITVWWLGHKRIQNIIPPCRSYQSEIKRIIVVPLYLNLELLIKQFQTDNKVGVATIAQSSNINFLKGYFCPRRYTVL